MRRFHHQSYYSSLMHRWFDTHNYSTRSQDFFGSVAYNQSVNSILYANGCGRMITYCTYLFAMRSIWRGSEVMNCQKLTTVFANWFQICQHELGLHDNQLVEWFIKWLTHCVKRGNNKYIKPNKLVEFIRESTKIVYRH